MPAARDGWLVLLALFLFSIPIGLGTWESYFEQSFSWIVIEIFCLFGAIIVSLSLFVLECSRSYYRSAAAFALLPGYYVSGFTGLVATPSELGNDIHFLLNWPSYSNQVKAASQASERQCKAFYWHDTLNVPSTKRFLLYDEDDSITVTTLHQVENGDGRLGMALHVAKPSYSWGQFYVTSVQHITGHYYVIEVLN